ncbi:hypothetical protein HDU67_003640 [Dinochytrium kinnereticum]|nr:hypothetical protein HDU67_003640 [Dinochytrium kinnereticum]
MARIKSSREASIHQRRGISTFLAENHDEQSMEADNDDNLAKPVSRSLFDEEDASGMMGDCLLHPAMSAVEPIGSLLSELDKDWVQRMMAEEWGRFSVDPMDPDAAADLEREIIEEVKAVTPGPWMSVKSSRIGNEVDMDGGINELAVGQADAHHTRWPGVEMDSMGNLVEAQFADHEATEMRDMEQAIETHYGGLYLVDETHVIRSSHRCPVCLQGTLWSAGALFGCDDCNLRMRFKVDVTPDEIMSRIRVLCQNHA